MFGEAEGRRRLGLIAVAQGKSRQPAFAEASAFAPGGFGGQDGGQPSRGWPAVAHATAGSRERRLVSLNFTSWNQLDAWLRQVDRMRRAA
jgi:hypothetical protein